MSRKQYGVPYKGSKSTIAKQIIDMLPPAENFYDMFAGGGAVTQCALESGKYRNVYANDSDGRALRLFVGASYGLYKNDTRWISREAFYANKRLPIYEQDPYISCCWSFGNNMRGYLYGANIEPLKRAAHYAVVHDNWTELDRILPTLSAKLRQEISTADTVSERRKRFSSAFKQIQKNEGMAIEAIPSSFKKPITRCGLEHLERADRIAAANIQPFDTSKITFLDYRVIRIRPDSVIYCDPPYAGTNRYESEFDHDAFYAWALSQTEPVYISEYDMPERFIRVASFCKQQNICATNTRVVRENLYIPYKQSSTTEIQLGLFDETNAV